MSARKKVLCLCTVHGCGRFRSSAQGGDGFGRELSKRTAFQHHLDQVHYNADEEERRSSSTAILNRRRPQPTAEPHATQRTDAAEDRLQHGRDDALAGSRPTSTEEVVATLVMEDRADESANPPDDQQWNDFAPPETMEAPQSESERSESDVEVEDGEEPDVISLIDEAVIDDIDRQLQQQGNDNVDSGGLQREGVDDENPAGSELLHGPVDAERPDGAESMPEREPVGEQSMTMDDWINPRQFNVHAERSGAPRDDMADIKWIKSLYLFVAFLGIRHNVSNVAQQRILRFACHIILPYYGHRKRSIVWARGLRRQLGLSTPLVRYTVCPNKNCFTLHPPAKALECCVCGMRLYHDSVEPRSKPRLEFAYNPLAEWLSTVVAEKGMVQRLDSWRLRRSRSDKLEDVYDGARWTEEHDYLSGDGVNLLLTLSLDWFQPFEFADSYSCGPILLNILNLPPDVRYRSSFTHLAGIIPGPAEPPRTTVHKFLEPLLLELVDLCSGIDVTITNDDGTTRNTRLRAKLFFFVGDTPARTKVCGYCSHMAKQNFCPFCLVSLEDRDLRGQGMFPPRSKEHHRNESLRAEGLRIAVQERIGNESGARYSALYRLEYWRSVRDSPVDVMHAVFLGIVRRMWHKLLVEGGLLPIRDLRIVQEMLADLPLPLGAARPSPLLGLPAGGSPTADQYITIARILPLILSHPNLWASALEDYKQNEEAIRIAMDTEDHPPVETRSHWAHLRHPKKGAGTAESVAPADDEERLTSARAAGTASPSSVRVFRSPSPTRRPTGRRQARVNRLLHKGWVFQLVVRISALVELLHRPTLTLDQVHHIGTLIECIVATLCAIPFMTYNAHIIKHIPEHIRAFGPPRVFWAFVGERANATLSRMLPRTNFKAKEVELTLMRAWSDRSTVERVARGDDIDEDLREILSDERSARLSTVDRQIVGVEAASADDVVLEHRCAPPAEHRARSIDRNGFALSRDAFRGMLELLHRHRQPYEAPFAEESLLGVSRGSVTEVINSVTFYASLTYRGGYYCSVRGRRNAAEGSTFAFVASRAVPEYSGAGWAGPASTSASSAGLADDRGEGTSTSSSAGGERYRPVQILDIFEHEYRQQPSRDRVRREYLCCKVFRPVEPPAWSLGALTGPSSTAPADLRYLDGCLVDAAAASLAVVRADDLVSNALVVRWPRTSLIAFKMFTNAF